MSTYKIVGLMSGTSLDGLDLAYCQLVEKNGKWDFKLLKNKSIGYEADMRERLKNAIFLDGKALLLLHNQYGIWLGKQALRFIEADAPDVDVIASHGHTSHHQPGLGLTFQLGSGQHLATTSGRPVVSDFRTLDIVLGGQGAPLVPIGDQLFFSAYSHCLNLGGISNVSFEYNGSRVAYDIGLANMLLNFIAQKTGLSFDSNGDLARKGTLLPELFKRLNNLEYYGLPFPKSTGYEWFLREVVPVIDETDASIEDLLHTAVHHICEQVAFQLRLYDAGPKKRLLVTGGGALNGFLIEVLKERVGPEFEVELPGAALIEFKEALVFALMGALRLESRINVLRSVTGASRDSSSGVIYYP